MYGVLNEINDDRARAPAEICRPRWLQGQRKSSGGANHRPTAERCRKYLKKMREIRDRVQLDPIGFQLDWSLGV